jgi:hypothetical protein
VFLDRLDVSGGEALAGLPRPGNAGSNTAADHVTVLDLALAQLPEHLRPTPEVAGGPQVLIRADSAGATHAFMKACRQRGVRYSVGLAMDQKIQDAIRVVPAKAWQPAISSDGELRENGEIVELTALLDLSAWPVGSRVICRRERPHPGAQYRFTDIDGHRFQVLLTDTPGRGNDIAVLELRHRQHARVEDRIRNGKDRGLRNLPCQDLHTNTAWVELALTAADLTTWAQALCFTGTLRRLEPKRLRYRVLHVAGRVVTTGRRLILRLDQDWPWAPTSRPPSTGSAPPPGQADQTTTRQPTTRTSEHQLPAPPDRRHTLMTSIARNLSGSRYPSAAGRVMRRPG